MTRIYLIRHAEAEGNLYRRIHGQYNSAITANGRRQIAALEERFKSIHVDAAYASPLRRTQITAQAVVRPKGLPLTIEPRIQEIGMGVLEDVTFGDVAYHDEPALIRFVTCSPEWQPEGGESFAQVQARMVAGVTDIARANPDKTVCVFSHGTAIHCFQSAVRGKTPAEANDIPHPENTSVSCYDYDGERFYKVFENDASHLTEDIATMARQEKERKAHGDRPFPQLWFRDADVETDGAFLAKLQQELGVELTGGKSCRVAMLAGEPVGLLQLDLDREGQQGIGWVPVFYLRKDFRGRGLGIQLLGEAVCRYRAEGKTSVQVQLSQGDETTRRFLEGWGFKENDGVGGLMFPIP